MSEEKKKKKGQPYIVMPPGRLSFPRLDKAEYFNEKKQEGRKTFSAACLYVKGTNLDQARLAVRNTAVDFFGSDLRPGMHNPIFDADADPDKASLEGYPGHFYITAKSETRPGLWLPDLSAFTGTVDEIMEKFYAGCWVRLKVQPFGFDEGKNKGVAWALGAIQWIKNDTPFSGGDKTAKGFDAVDEADDDFLR